MKNETKAFFFLALAVFCYGTHELCDALFWVAAASYNPRPASDSISFGGIALFVFAAAFFLAAVYFFVKAAREK